MSLSGQAFRLTRKADSSHWLGNTERKHCGENFHGMTSETAEGGQKRKSGFKEVEDGGRQNGAVLASLIISLFAVELFVAAVPHNTH